MKASSPTGGAAPVLDRQMRSGGQNPSHVSGLPAAEEIQSLMWRHAGLFRNAEGLQDASTALNAVWQVIEQLDDAALGPDARRTVSLITVGRLIVRAALRRTESRGAHYREDYPVRDDIHWKRRVSDSR